MSWSPKTWNEKLLVACRVVWKDNHLLEAGTALPVSLRGYHWFGWKGHKCCATSGQRSRACKWWCHFKSPNQLPNETWVIFSSYHSKRLLPQTADTDKSSCSSRSAHCPSQSWLLPNSSWGPGGGWGKPLAGCNFHKTKKEQNLPVREIML